MECEINCTKDFIKKETKCKELFRNDLLVISRHTQGNENNAGYMLVNVKGN